MWTKLKIVQKSQLSKARKGVTRLIKASRHNIGGPGIYDVIVDIREIKVEIARNGGAHVCDTSLSKDKHC